MPPTDSMPRPLGAEDFAKLVAAVKAAVAVAVAEQIQKPQPQSFDTADTIAYVGLSQAAVYRLLAAGKFPKPVAIDGSRQRWLRKHLDAWLERQKPKRRKATET